MIANVITDNLDVWTSAIKPKAAAGRGRSGKQELYGIKKLRELILELAVRGLLVEQDAGDEPASVLLEKIAKEKAGLVKEGRIKKLKALPDISEEEMPFELPEGWEWCRLGMLSEIIRGVTYKKHDVSERPTDNTTPLMRANNIGAGINYESLIYIPSSIVKKEQLIVNGDILIAMSSGSSSLVGKAAQAHSDLHNTFGAFCAVIRPMSSVIYSFLGFYCSTPFYRKQTQATGKGIGIQNLNKAALESLFVPVPPVAEQTRIVNKVNELMTLCDHLEQQTEESLAAHNTLVETLLAALTNAPDHASFSEAWQRITEHFDTLFTTEQSIDQLQQTILQLAVMGKLVKQDPNDEPASVLLEKIAAEKAKLIKEKKIKKQKALPPIEDNEKSFELPEGWEWSRFGYLVNFKSELVSPSKFPDLDQVAPDSIEKNTGKLLSRRTVRESGVRGPNNRFYTGQLLYSKIRPSLNKVIIAPFDGLCSADMYPMDVMIDTDFLLKTVLSEVFLNQVRVFENRIKMPKLNIDSLSNIMVPLPPLPEQTRIVKKVDELTTFCTQLKCRLAESQTTQLQLADAITDQAIAG